MDFLKLAKYCLQFDFSTVSFMVYSNTLPLQKLLSGIVGDRKGGFHGARIISILPLRERRSPDLF